MEKEVEKGIQGWGVGTKESQYIALQTGVFTNIPIETGPERERDLVD